MSSLISVDLPAPFSPTMAWISPRSKARSTDFSACVRAEALVEPVQDRAAARRHAPRPGAPLLSASHPAGWSRRVAVESQATTDARLLQPSGSAAPASAASFMLALVIEVRAGVDVRLAPSRPWRRRARSSRRHSPCGTGPARRAPAIVAVAQEASPVLSSLSKPISLILSGALFSAIAWPAPWRHDQVARRTRRAGSGLAVIRSVMMFRPVVAWPSATLSATSFRPGYLAASSSLKPLARWSSEPTPGSEVISATSPSALP